MSINAHEKLTLHKTFGGHLLIEKKKFNVCFNDVEQKKTNVFGIQINTSRLYKITCMDDFPSEFSIN